MTDSVLSSLRRQGLPIISIIGRPNVGKSTLFNRLIQKRRAITDPTPGVTRDPIPEKWLLGNNQVLLVDTGGIKLEQEGLDSLVTERALSILEISDAVILLMDVTEVSQEDEVLIERLRPFSDKLILAVNKVDSPSRDDLVYDYYRFGYERVIPISSAHGLGIDLLEKTLPKESTEGLTVIDQESRRLRVLTDRINDFLRNPVGTPEPIEVRGMIRSLTERFETPITFTSNSMKKAYISIDPSRARSIFENLLKNAIESTDERDPQVSVEITRTKKRFLYIYIRDRGDGIDPKHLDKIYDPFFTTKVKGSGIGLSISRQFVRARGGDLKLYNREGGGTVVEILLPLSHV